MKVEMKLTGPDGDVQRQRGGGRMEGSSTKKLEGERLERLQRKTGELKEGAGKDSALKRVCFERKIIHWRASSSADIIGWTSKISVCVHEG